MKRGDYDSLARLDCFSPSAYGIIVNDKCTEGFVVVAYDTDDFKFRLNVRCELVDVIAPPKYKVGDKVKYIAESDFQSFYNIEMNRRMRQQSYTIESFYYANPKQGWWYYAKGDPYSANTSEDCFELTETETVCQQ